MVIEHDQEEMFRVINENSNRVRMQKERVRTRVEDYNLKREKKEKFKKRAKEVLLSAVIISGIVIGGVTAMSYGTSAIERQKQLDNANSYMNKAINFVCPELDRGVLSDGTVVLFDNDESSYKQLCDVLQSDFGLSRDCAIYCIAEHYGDEAFDKITRIYGYEGKDNFLYECYSRPTSISSSGDTIYTKEGSYKVFENNVQVELVNRVEQIKKMMDQRNVESKGMTK